MSNHRDFATELRVAAAAGDWDAHARIWDERRAAEVEADESALHTTEAHDVAFDGGEEYRVYRNGRLHRMVIERMRDGAMLAFHGDDAIAFERELLDDVAFGSDWVCSRYDAQISRVDRLLGQG